MICYSALHEETKRHHLFSELLVNSCSLGLRTLRSHTSVSPEELNHLFPWDVSQMSAPGSFAFYQTANVLCGEWGSMSVHGAGGSLEGRQQHMVLQGWGMHNRSLASEQSDTSTQRECVARQGLAQKGWCLTSFSFQGCLIANFKSRHGWH